MYRIYYMSIITSTPKSSRAEPMASSLIVSSSSSQSSILFPSSTTPSLLSSPLSLSLSLSLCVLSPSVPPTWRRRLGGDALPSTRFGGTGGGGTLLSARSCWRGNGGILPSARSGEKEGGWWGVGGGHDGRAVPVGLMALCSPYP